MTDMVQSASITASPNEGYYEWGLQDTLMEFLRGESIKAPDIVTYTIKNSKDIFY